MTRWIGPAAWSRRESRAGARLPYARHVTAETILLRDGALMRSLRVPGLAFETEEAAQLDQALAVREVMLRSALDARFVLHHHVIRRRVRVSLNGSYPDPFSASLDSAWQTRLAERPLFVNEQFLTLVRRPARGKTGWPDRLRRIGRAAGQPEPGDLRDLDAAIKTLAAGLTFYGARPLTQVETASGALRSEPLELLSALYNGEWRPALAPGEEVDLGNHLPYARVSFGLDALEVKGPAGRSYGAMLSLKDYPDSTRAGLLDDVLRLPHELVLSESFVPADRQIARERIDLALRRLRSADEEGGAERAEMLAARDALGAGQTGFGDHHLTVLVRAPDLDSLDGAVAETAAQIAEIGAVAVREDVNLEPAFWGQFPGNESYIVRRALVSTANAAGFLSLHGFPMGRRHGAPWGEAVSVLETSSATPYFFNFHQGDLGNFTVIGPSGSGKTVVLNFLAAQARKASPRTIFFDKDRGAEIFLRACGGHYARLSPGQPTGFNPLRLPDSPLNRAFLRDWLACLTRAAGAEELLTISAAVDAAYQQDPAFRRLRHFRELLAGGKRPEPGDLISRLEPWIGQGEHGWMFDNDRDRLDLDVQTLGFDITELLDRPALRTPALMYLFHRIDERLDGEPTMILIDEGWKALDDAVFAARLRDWMKTLRKRNAIVGFATQSARDALDSSIASAIVEQTATMIFTPNAKAREEDYCQGFGLTPHELELIRAMPAQGRCFLVRQANQSVVVRLDLEDMPDLLKVLSGREATVRRLDMIREAVGDDPANWYSILTGAAWPGEPAEPVAEAAE